LKIKVLFLLALTFLAAISTIAIASVTLKKPSVPFSVTETIAVTTGFGDIQPTGDPVDNPAFPS